ncbi:ornithine carbamoyltransferase [Alteromonas oceanisediminis]|uniref:ornithine carbamoyltransferase n=1 Tax=Alteromonas oceanisediminis TaxID=2836180 RepID=UPI001BDA1F17|nr:ornithine carbamoyltransferase [Alteromonas oceanisediminis]MBT0586081.1 ornithine carbamoyltransferase [Alteromonas oceanisediminis]
MSTKDLLSFTDWTPEAATQLLQLALDIKATPENYATALAGKSIIALFEKPSLRTRVSFDIGIHKLGGHLVYLDSQSGNLAGREDVKDMGANFACWADAIIARVFSHSTLETLAEAASVPVINALCDRYHPCQAMADYLTLTEALGSVKGKTLAYVGDGNNVTHSLLIVGALLGCHQVVVTPKGHEIDSDILKQAHDIGQRTGATITTSHALSALSEPTSSVDAIYTDTWLSMGDITPLEDIKSKFMPYQVNEAMLENCGARYVMHCQPAHRDLEITGSLMDSRASLLMQQAENRMHAQNAILVTLLTR